MSAPPSPFAHAFRAHVIPALRPQICFRAQQVVWGVLTFSEAEAELIARAHGATHLDRDTFAQFVDWLDAQLVEAIARHERILDDIEATERQAARILSQQEAA